MKIAYCSDLHLDFFFREGSNIRNGLGMYLTDYFKGIDSETLIIAGDTSHFSPEYETEVLLTMKDVLGVKDIITVNGNHSGYLLGKELKDRFSNGLQLCAYRTDLYNANGIHALEGNYIEIGGIRIGGSDSFYDGSIYYRDATHYTSNVEAYWKRSMNDSYNMKLSSFGTYAEEQKVLLRKLRDSVDVMVTHVKPVISNEYFHPKYSSATTNAFYSFDFGQEIAEDKRLKAWVYGHTHDVEEYTHHGVKLLANPRGYPYEVKDHVVKHLEVS